MRIIDKHLIVFFITLVVFSLSNFSCVRQRDLISYKQGDVDQKIYKIDSILEYRVMKGDRVDVQVMNNTGQEIDVFNKQVVGKQDQVTLSRIGYDVDAEGKVDLPMIGKVVAEGKTIAELDSVIEMELAQYITFAYVKTRLMNFQVTFLGEFKATGTITYEFAELNLLQGVGLAGDFTDYADRDAVKVYRKNSKGELQLFVIDLSGDKVFEADQFVLLPNDVVYAPPMKVKVVRLNSPTITIALSVLTFVAVMLTFVNNI